MTTGNHHQHQNEHQHHQHRRRTNLQPVHSQWGATTTTKKKKDILVVVTHCDCCWWLWYFFLSCFFSFSTFFSYFVSSIFFYISSSTSFSFRRQRRKVQKKIILLLIIGLVSSINTTIPIMTIPTTTVHAFSSLSSSSSSSSTISSSSLSTTSRNRHFTTTTIRSPNFDYHNLHSPPSPFYYRCSHHHRRRRTTTTTSSSSTSSSTSLTSSSSSSSSTTTALSMVFYYNIDDQQDDETTTMREEEISKQEEQLDSIIDECLRMSGRKPIMIQFEPSSKAIWRHWKGTILADTWKSTLRHVIWASIVYFILHRILPIKITSHLKDYSYIYTQMISITTFTLTFFVNQSYIIWRTCLNTCRILQGRLNDLIMSVAGFANRIDVTQQQQSKHRSVFTNESHNLLLVVARYIRLFNILSFASLTRSHRPLLTPNGMRKLVSRGLLTSQEKDILVNANISVTQRHNAVLMWILRVVIEGRKAGHIDGGFGFEQQIMAKTQEIRAQGNSIESVLKGRMPFAYAHIVQILVDGILWSYPINAYSQKLSWPLALVGTAILTTGYQGLFDLAKQLLDPFYNENFWSGDDPLIVDTLIAETNAGSLRWMYALEEMPISYTNMKQGQFNDYILPDEGYTREQAEIYDKERRIVEELKDAQQESILSLQELETKRVEKLEVVDDELKETQRILEAPPGYDFVPGIDDTIDDENDDMNDTADESDSTNDETIKDE